MAFCRKCGTHIREGIRFCSGCGTPIEMPPAPIQPSVPQATLHTTPSELSSPNSIGKSKGNDITNTSITPAAIAFAAIVILLSLVIFSISIAKMNKNSSTESFSNDEDSSGSSTRHSSDQDHGNLRDNLIGKWVLRKYEAIKDSGEYEDIPLIANEVLEFSSDGSWKLYYSDEYLSPQPAVENGSWNITGRDIVHLSSDRGNIPVPIVRLDRKTLIRKGEPNPKFGNIAELTLTYEKASR